ncbi:hypothetical protein [Reyranella sp.]|uniref:hypothetical protein n=1 Tax=Reyranella sp. TaxID=1929291 RepID=UPI003C7E6A1A
MSPHLSAAITLICTAFAVVFAIGGNGVGAALLGFVAGGWFVKFIDDAERAHPAWTFWALCRSTIALGLVLAVVIFVLLMAFTKAGGR